MKLRQYIQLALLGALLLCTAASVSAQPGQPVTNGAADPRIRVAPAHIAVATAEHFAVTISLEPNGAKIGEIVPPPAPYVICGYVFDELGTPCNNPQVTITNLNTREHWRAEMSASSHYYHLSLASGVDLAVGEVLQFNATGLQGIHPTVIEHTVTQDEVNTGGLYNFTITLETEPVSFDTGTSDNPYPSIPGVYNGTIKPDRQIEANAIYTYACPGTGGHAEYVRIWGTGVDEVASWNGYTGDWRNLTFNESFVLHQHETYNYTIRTGSYPQIIHTHSEAYEAYGGEITCTEFRDANGITHENWLPAIRLWHEGA
jgi:hypothetical protein